MKKVFKCLLKIVEIIVILYVIFMSTCLLCRNRYGYTQFEDKTLVSIGEKDTKELTEFKKDSLVLFKEKDIEDINIGDKVYYYAVKNEKYIIKVGKVLEKKGEASGTLYRFEENSDVAVAGTKILGTYDKAYDDIGGMLLFLESRIGFLIFVLLPILLLFIYEIYDLVVSVKYEEDDTPKKKKKSKKKVSEKKKDDVEEIETL